MKEEELNIYYCANLFGDKVMIVSKKEKEMIEEYRNSNSYNQGRE